MYLFGVLLCLWRHRYDAIDNRAPLAEGVLALRLRLGRTCRFFYYPNPRKATPLVVSRITRSVAMNEPTLHASQNSTCHRDAINADNGERVFSKLIFDVIHGYGERSIYS